MSIFKETRLILGLTQKDMANKLNVKYKTYLSYEQGYKMPPYKVVSCLLKIRNKGTDLELAKILDSMLENRRKNDKNNKEV